MGIDVISTSVATDPAINGALTASWHQLSGFHVALPQNGDLFSYFKALDDVLTALTGSGDVEAVEGIMSHIDYLAGKAGCYVAVILGGSHFTTDRQIILDALANIGSVLQAASRNWPEQPPEGIPDDVFALILEAEAKLAGWCSREKSLTIARMVLQERPKTCVEIGIFGGRSLVPCAAALRHIGAGEI